MRGMELLARRYGARSRAELRSAGDSTAAHCPRSMKARAQSILLKSSSASSGTLIDDTEFQTLMSPERAGLTSGSPSYTGDVTATLPRTHGLIFRPLVRTLAKTGYIPKYHDKNLLIHDNWQLCT